MDSRTLVLVALATLVAPGSSAVVGIADGPIENGDFEGPFLPAEVRDGARGTPVDECTGIGHQIFYGPETVPGYLTGGKALDPSPSDADPEKAAGNLTNDPVWWAQFQSGYQHCTYDPKGQGVDVVWLNVADRINQPAFWSVHPRIPSASFGYDFDDDPFDREVQFVNDTDLANHNMWQSYVSQPGLYTAGFDTLEFTVESGELPDNAVIQFHLISTPLERQSPYLAGYLECTLTLGNSFQADGQGHVVTDALDGALTPDRNADGSFDDECDDVIDTYNDPGASDAEKREALDRLRIVQVSFRNFNAGSGPVVIDDVTVTGDQTAAHSLLGANVNAQPDLDPDDF